MVRNTKAQPRTRGWCFTVNNPTPDDMANIMDAQSDYFIVGDEIAPTTGTVHLQGYIYFKNKIRKDELIKRIPRTHFEPQKGSFCQAIYYCMKKLSYYEEGDRPNQGHRTDLDLIHMDLKSGKKTANQIKDYNFKLWCQYNRSFEKYQALTHRYNTQMIMYDAGNPAYSFNIIYNEYPIASVNPQCESYVFLNNYVTHPEIFEAYYSGRYRYVIIPNNIIDSQVFTKYVVRYIEEPCTDEDEL